MPASCKRTRPEEGTAEGAQKYCSDTVIAITGNGMDARQKSVTLPPAALGLHEAAQLQTSLVPTDGADGAKSAVPELWQQILQIVASSGLPQPPAASQAHAASHLSVPLTALLKAQAAGPEASFKVARKSRQHAAEGNTPAPPTTCMCSPLRPDLTRVEARQPSAAVHVVHDLADLLKPRRCVKSTLPPVACAPAERRQRPLSAESTPPAPGAHGHPAAGVRPFSAPHLAAVIMPGSPSGNQSQQQSHHGHSSCSFRQPASEPQATQPQSPQPPPAVCSSPPGVVALTDAAAREQVQAAYPSTAPSPPAGECINTSPALQENTTSGTDSLTQGRAPPAPPAGPVEVTEFLTTALPHTSSSSMHLSSSSSHDTAIAATSPRTQTLAVPPQPPAHGAEPLQQPWQLLPSVTAQRHDQPAVQPAAQTVAMTGSVRRCSVSAGGTLGGQAGDPILARPGAPLARGRRPSSGEGMGTRSSHWCPGQTPGTAGNATGPKGCLPTEDQWQFVELQGVSRVRSYPVDAGWGRKQVVEVYMRHEQGAKEKVQEVSKVHSVPLPSLLTVQGIADQASTFRVAALTSLPFLHSCAKQLSQAQQESSHTTKGSTSATATNLPPIATCNGAVPAADIAIPGISAGTLSVFVRLIEGIPPDHITVQNACELVAATQACGAHDLLSALPEYLAPLLRAASNSEVVWILACSMRATPAHLRLTLVDRFVTLAFPPLPVLCARSNRAPSTHHRDTPSDPPTVASLAIFAVRVLHSAGDSAAHAQCMLHTAALPRAPGWLRAACVAVACTTCGGRVDSSLTRSACLYSTYIVDALLRCGHAACCAAIRQVYAAACLQTMHLPGQTAAAPSRAQQQLLSSVRQQLAVQEQAYEVSMVACSAGRRDIVSNAASMTLAAADACTLHAQVSLMRVGDSIILPQHPALPKRLMLLSKLQFPPVSTPGMEAAAVCGAQPLQSWQLRAQLLSPPAGASAPIARSASPPPAPLYAVAKHTAVSSTESRGAAPEGPSVVADGGGSSARSANAEATPAAAQQPSQGDLSPSHNESGSLASAAAAVAAGSESSAGHAPLLQPAQPAVGHAVALRSCRGRDVSASVNVGFVPDVGALAVARAVQSVWELHDRKNMPHLQPAVFKGVHTHAWPCQKQQQFESGATKLWEVTMGAQQPTSWERWLGGSGAGLAGKAVFAFSCVAME